LGFKKVKDLARATLGKASSMKLCGDSLTLLYGAIEVTINNIQHILDYILIV